MRDTEHEPSKDDAPLETTYSRTPDIDTAGEWPKYNERNDAASRRSPQRSLRSAFQYSVSTADLSASVFTNSPAASDIEVTDVPPGELPIVPEALIVLGSHFSPQSPVWRWTTVGGIVIFVLLVLFSSYPASLLAPAVTAVPTPREHVPLILDSNLLPILKPAPQNCPSTAPLHSFDPAFPPGVGDSPVWVTGFSGPHARLVHLDDSRQQPQEFGWAYNLLLVEKSDYIRPVVISGDNLQDGSPLFFEDGISIRGQKSVTAFFELAADHPRLPSKYDTQWKAWTVIMYVPAAGCYSLEALWPEGGWQVNFAAGR